MTMGSKVRVDQRALAAYVVTSDGRPVKACEVRGWLSRSVPGYMLAVAGADDPRDPGRPTARSTWRSCPSRRRPSPAGTPGCLRKRDGGGHSRPLRSQASRLHAAIGVGGAAGDPADDQRQARPHIAARPGVAPGAEGVRAAGKRNGANSARPSPRCSGSLRLAWTTTSIRSAETRSGPSPSSSKSRADSATGSRFPSSRIHSRPVRSSRYCRSHNRHWPVTNWSVPSRTRASPSCRAIKGMWWLTIYSRLRSMSLDSGWSDL